MQIRTREKDKKSNRLNSTIKSAEHAKFIYMKSKRKADKQINNDYKTSTEYADKTLNDISSDIADISISNVKNNIRKLSQNKKDNSKTQKKTYFNKSNKDIYKKAIIKEKMTNNKVKLQSFKNNKLKDKIIDFIKGGTVSILNTVKNIAIHTKITTAALLFTGSVAVIFTLLICIIGLVICSSFGIFMSTEDTGTGYTITSVIHDINEEYLEEIEQITQEVQHDYVVVTENKPEWKNILAIYAVKTTTAQNGMEVVTVDEEKSEIVKNIFWDMTKITYETEVKEEIEIIEMPDENGNIVQQEITVQKTYLTIDTENVEPNEMFIQYGFNDEQIKLFNEMTSEENNVLWGGFIIENSYM